MLIKIPPEKQNCIVGKEMIANSRLIAIAGFADKKDEMWGGKHPNGAENVGAIYEDGR